MSGSSACVVFRWWLVGCCRHRRQLSVDLILESWSCSLTTISMSYVRLSTLHGYHVDQSVEGSKFGIRSEICKLNRR